MTKKVDGCQLEVDRSRGVVYVHSPEGRTLLRVCRIPPAVADSEFIDVVFDRELAKGYPGVEEININRRRNAPAEKKTK